MNEDVNLASARPKPSASAQPLKGVTILIGAVACFACMDASVKWLNRELNPIQIAGVRYFVSLLAVAMFMNPWTHPKILKTKRLGLQCGRALFLAGSTLGVFLALRSLPLTQLTSINFSAPLVAALLSWPVLGERIGPRRLAAVLVGFGGVLIVTRPFNGHMQPSALFAVFAALCGASYYVITRLLAAHDPPETTMFYTSLVGTLAVSPLTPFFWKTPSTLLVWTILIALGCFGALGHWLLILAHRHAPSSVLAPFFYAQIIGSVIFGWVIFGELPDRWTIVGAVTIVLSGLYLLYRERIRQKYPSADVSV